MSRTKKGKKPSGFDFWSRRHNVSSYGPIPKWITKRYERQRNRRMCQKAMDDPELFEKRFPGE